MVDVGDVVKLGDGGVSRFRVLEIDGPTATVETIEDAPGRYPFPARVADLRPVEAPE
ncbi:hypothetical protein [Nocardia farcinica]|uniref:hypothetical protein n=1 Tax=Nocardia farcinica TaxID=37329 RepID=UPI000A8DBDA5|nr:hypothetical protein [Nocardia farcinica]MBA4858060.1 hypothetical protein [Nocardia farcinica]MBC9819409.1 hypothetical protein [Nocardia farcinica]UEX21208.1 hypothetical protein LMJ57_19605 [Nocardia farcinica]